MPHRPSWLGKVPSEHLKGIVPQRRVLPQTGIVHVLLSNEVDLSRYIEILQLFRRTPANTLVSNLQSSEL